VTRREQIIAVDLLLQQLRAEQRIADWLESHTAVSVFSFQTLDGGARFACHVRRDYSTIAQGLGETESDARAQAFQAIFANEASAKQEAST